MEVTVGFGSDFWFDCVALLVGCTIDCHSEISSSLVRGHVPGSNLHGTVPPLVIASNLCKVDPHDACFKTLQHIRSCRGKKVKSRKKLQQDDTHREMVQKRKNQARCTVYSTELLLVARPLATTSDI